MDRDEFMELVYETFADEPDNVLANGIIEAADAYAEHEKAQLSSEGTTSDLISRQQAIDALDCINGTEEVLRSLPPARPEPTDINAKEAVYNLAEKIGIHQLFALTVELRGEPIQPEPHEGHWIEGGIYRGLIECNCSECGQLMTTVATVRMNYCPKCGARMKGERQK